MIVIPCLVSVAVMVWALWVRRNTWHNKWEVGATSGIALHALAVILICPITGNLIDPPLYGATGVFNIEDLVGHMCYIGAAFAGAYNALVRVSPGQVMSSRLRVMEAACVIILAFMIAAFLLGNGSEIYRPDFFAVPIDGWLAVYWATLACGALFLILYGARALRVLRVDQRSKQVAGVNLAMVATAVAMIVTWPTVALLVNTDIVMPHLAVVAVWACVLVCGTALAITSAYTWRRKQATT